MKKIILIISLILIASGLFGQTQLKKGLIVGADGVADTVIISKITIDGDNLIKIYQGTIQRYMYGQLKIADTASMLTKYARKASPTFTGTVTLPSGTSIGDVSSTEIGYVNNVTSAIQTQINGKLNISDTAAMLVPYINRVDTSGMLTPYINRVDTATMLTPYARKASPTFTGVPKISTDTIATRAYARSVTSAIQTQIGAKLDTADFHTGGSGGSITLVGNDAITLTTTAATSVTLPTSGTLATIQNIKDSLDTYIADAETGIALKDTNGYAVGSYATRLALYNYSDPVHSAQLIGSSVKAISLGMTLASCTGTSTMSDGITRFVAVYIESTETITGVMLALNTAGDYTADNYNGVGLYSEASGTLTLRASSADDGNIWKTAATSVITKAFSSTYVATPGLYYVAILWNNSAVNTSPKLATMGLTSAAYLTLDFPNSVKLCGYKSGHTALPASIELSTIGNEPGMPLVYLY